MNIHERLRRFLPESKKLPIEARSLEGLIQIAKANGVKDFVAVQTLGREKTLDDQCKVIEHTSNYSFLTQKRRAVIFEEVHGELPASETDELKHLVTAASRVNLLNSNGILANVVDGWFGYKDEALVPSVMDFGFLLHQLDHADEKDIKAFPHPLLNGS